MASSTPNINLTLPVGSEHVSRQIINDNFTKIDTAIGALPSGQNLHGEIDALNNNITTLSEQIANLHVTTLTGSDAITTSHTLSSASLVRIGNMVLVNAIITLTSNVSIWSNFATINQSYKPANPTRGYGDKGDTILPVYVGTQGNLQLISGGGTSGQTIVLTTIYSLA